MRLLSTPFITRWAALTLRQHRSCDAGMFYRFRHRFRGPPGLSSTGGTVPGLVMLAIFAAIVVALLISSVSFGGSILVD